MASPHPYENAPIPSWLAVSSVSRALAVKYANSSPGCLSEPRSSAWPVTAAAGDPQSRPPSQDRYATLSTSTALSKQAMWYQTPMRVLVGW